MVTQWKHDTLSTWGIGTELSEQQWRGVVRQLLALGLLAVNDDGYGTLVITPESGAVLSGGRTVQLRREPERAARTRGSGGSGGAGGGSGSGRSGSAAKESLSASDAELFEALRAWRATTAKEQGVPAYVVFHDATLATIAQLKPTSPEGLVGIPGIGDRKRESYGPGLIEALAAALGGDAASTTTPSVSERGGDGTARAESTASGFAARGAQGSRAGGARPSRSRAQTRFTQRIDPADLPHDDDPSWADAPPPPPDYDEYPPYDDSDAPPPEHY